MNPAFAPPPDSTRREAEAVEIDYEMLPTHLRAGMRRYLDQGIPTGSFLRAVLENDLAEAVLRADNEARPWLLNIVIFLHGIPPEAWGSTAAVAAWIAARKAEA